MRTFKTWIIGIGLTTCMPLAHADSIPWGLNPALNDKVFVGLGAFLPKINGQVQLDSPNGGVGTVVDFQNLLGMSDQASAADGAIRVRLGERWRIEASYFQLTQSGDRAIDRDIHWGGIVYPINTELSSKMQFSDLRVSAGYSIFKTSDKELGVGLGLHVLGYKASIRSDTLGSESTDVLAPLPVLSVYGQFALDDQWSAGFRLDRLSLTYGQYSGGITVMGLDLLYQPFRHVGFGLGFRSMLLNFTDTGNKATVKLNQNIQGPALFLTVSF